jgi:O-antigen/teichoic acid export membrane protein
MTGSPYSKAALRRSAWHFLTGKVATAGLSLGILLVVVRLLPVAEYASYVTLSAATEVLYPLSLLGLPWLASRFLPEFRLNASSHTLRRLVRDLALAVVMLLLLAAIAVAVVAAAFPDLLAESAIRALLAIYLVMFVADSLGRFARENLLGPLMQQGWVRASQVGRQAVFLGLLMIGMHRGTMDVEHVVAAEAAAASGATLLAFVGLSLHLRRLAGEAGRTGWAPPARQEMWRTARDMYLARLLSLPYSPQALLLLVQRALNAEAVALFGFMRHLFVQVANNLPSTMLFSLVQPKLVASQVDAGVHELSRNANLAGKLSLFALMPLVATAWLAGDPIVVWLSGGKFVGAGGILAGMLLAIVPFSQRLLIETVTVALGRSRLCTYASAIGLVVLLLLIVLLKFGFGVWAPVITLVVSYALFNAVVQTALARSSGYTADYGGATRLLASGAVCGIALLPLGAFVNPHMAVWIQTVLVLPLYLLVAWILKPFTIAERERMNLLIGRRVFIW